MLLFGKFWFLKRGHFWLLRIRFSYSGVSLNGYSEVSLATKGRVLSLGGNFWLLRS